MVDLQFLGQNLHFAIGLLAALSTFAAAWLYFDAWTNERGIRNLLRWGGFFFLSLSFVVYAIDVPLIGEVAKESSTRYGTISEIIRVIGYIMIIVAEVLTPLMKVPSHKELFPSKEAKLPAVSFLPGTSGSFINVLPVIGAVGVAAMYWRRATTGLERHLKPVAFAFIGFSIFEILSQAQLLRSSSNVAINQAVAIYGPIWLAENIALLISSILIGRWVWRYLTKRFMSQLFMIFTSAIIIVFLATTLTFTFILLKGVKDATLANLTTTANVLNYALDSKRAETISGAEALSYNPQYISAISSKDHEQLNQLAGNYLSSKKLSSLIITTDTGQVLLRAEDPDRWGDSLSSDPLVRRGLIGQRNSSITSVSGTIAPTMQINSTVPVRDSSNVVIGTITTGVALDDAFVDGIRKSTGLDASIYSENVRSATTTLTADGKSRWVGIKEQNPTVSDKVLKNGETYADSINILNRPYLAVYQPLKDVDNTTVGMILVGQPQSELLKTANQSIQKTFILAAVLLVLSVIPAYFAARYIVKQL